MAKWISAASQMDKVCDKYATAMLGIGQAYETAYENMLTLERNKMKRIGKLACVLMDDFQEVQDDHGSKKALHTYFVTVRPKPTATWEEFFDATVRFSQRKPLHTYTLVFEQKGVDPITMGEGFHMHMLIEETSFRSKADVLRAAQSTYADITAANCVKVDALKTVKDVETALAYIMEWSSKDGHKAETKNMDIAWRSSLGLDPSYGGGLSSTCGPKISEANTPPSHI